MPKIMRQRTQILASVPTGEHPRQRALPRLPQSPSARAPGGPPAETFAFSIQGFCRSHGISRTHFYNLRRIGGAPTVMQVGRRTLISAEAAAEWRRRMEGAARDVHPDGYPPP